MWKLFRRKTVWRPTLPGGALLFVCFVLLARLSAPGLYRFFAVSQPLGGSILVVEGWVPDEAIVEIPRRIQGRLYTHVYCTGGPVEIGQLLTGYGTWAQVGAERLIQAGLPREFVMAVPASTVLRDRTLNSARALRARLNADSVPAGTVIDLVTVGPHARRSRLLFRRALGREYPVRALCLDDASLNARNWWRSSDGFKTVMYELLAYLYSSLHV